MTSIQSVRLNLGVIFFAIGGLCSAGEGDSLLAEAAEKREEALHLTASVHAENGDYDAAIVSAKEYLGEQKFRRYRDSCRMILGSSHAKAGRLDDALVAYQQILSSSNSLRSKFTQAAMLRWMELLWARNGKNKGMSDRQFSYERGREYLKLTVNAARKAGPEEKAIRDKISKLVRTYEDSPDRLKVIE